MSETVKDKTYPALVAAHSRMLAALSGDIAAAIRTVAAAGRKGNPEVAK